MSSHRKKSENLRKKLTKSEDTLLLNGLSLNNSHLDINPKTLEKCMDLSCSDLEETLLLQSRIKEQAHLICVLKEKSDELFKQCKTLQQVKAQLEKQLDSCQKDVIQKHQRAELVEKRFLDLDANSQAIIAFMEEYKRQNVQLKQENKQLQAENDRLFSQKLHDKEVIIQNLTKKIKALTEEFTTKETAYQERQEMASSYLEQLSKAQQQQEVTEEMLKGQQLSPIYLHMTYQGTLELLSFSPSAVKLKLQTIEEEHALKEATLNKSILSLTKEKEKVLRTSVEQENILQKKLKELQLLELHSKELKKAQLKAEERFKQQAHAVNADKRVRSLKSALEEARTKYEMLQKDFEAFKEHSNSLLTKERELNKILRHLRS
ncbi:coiled-coil domain-containing protein 89 isoform X2 [Syngnathus typhle]|uniref:coiled-coil domain-containing protein 89 isoform X2 n=1 Tax=Syngnathus typhle TaxID=161592 RepID=UPI002A69BEB6|nr:coiled-coil domain-containing protein 89 isoform X2 [Syngnathus typhle]